MLLQLFVRGNPFRAGKNSRENWPELVQQLIGQQRLAGLVVYGSPYLWQELQALLPTELPAAYSPGKCPPPKPWPWPNWGWWVMPMRAVLPTKALPEMPLNLWGDLATSGHAQPLDDRAR